MSESIMDEIRDEIMDRNNSSKSYGRCNRNKRKFIEWHEKQVEVEASRPPLPPLPPLQPKIQDLIVQKMKKVFKAKVTDRWLLWTKTKLLREHPDHSSEKIDEELLKCAEASHKWTGKDLSLLISALNDTEVIPSTKISCYFSIGMSSIAEYLRKGGKYHLILFDDPSMLDHPVLSKIYNKFPVVFIMKLKYAIAAIIKNHQQEIIGLKQVEGNPFHDLVKFVASNIPDTYATWVPSWKENIDNIGARKRENVDNVGPGNIDVGPGNIDNLGAGNIDNAGAGNIGNVGTGNIDNVGVGNIDNVGTGNIDKIGDRNSTDDTKESTLESKNLQIEISVTQGGSGEHLNNVSNGQEQTGRKLNKGRKEWKHSPALSEFLKKHPMIQQPHRDIVLQEIKCVFENKMTDRWLLMRKDKLLKNKVDYSPEEMEWILYDMILQKEEYAGRNIIHVVLSLTDPELVKTRKNVYDYITIGVPDITEYIKGGGEYHFITYCKRAMKSISKRPQLLDLVTNNTPVFPLGGLSDVITELIFCTSCAILGFKKVKNNPFDELVRFVADKIPDELPWIASWKENIGNVKDEVVCKDDDEMCNKDLPEKMDGKCITDNVTREVECGPPLKKMIKNEKVEMLDLKLQPHQQQSILQKISDYFRSRVTDRWLFWKSESVKRNHPEYTTADIEETLISALWKNDKYAGKDFKYLIKRMNDPSMIKSTMISQYLAIGIHNVNHHLKNGGDFHLVLYSKVNVIMTNQLQEAVLRNIPVCLVTGPPTLPEVTRLIVGDHGPCDVLGLKKAKGNPFYDLVKFVAYKVHDGQSYSIREWKQKIIHTLTDEGPGEIKENPISSDSEHSNVTKRDLEEDCMEVSSFTEKCQILQAHHQTMILEEIRKTFSQKLTDKWLTIKNQKLHHRHPNLSPEDIEYNLFEIVIQREEHVGKDLIELASSLRNPTLINSKNEVGNYLITTPDRICQYIIDGGTFHLILYCNQAYSSLSKNNTFQSVVTNTPLFLVSGLTELISQFMFIKPPAVVAFKKVKGFPFMELVKFVADTIPDDNSPWIKLWKESVCDECEKCGEIFEEGVVSGSMSVSTMDY